MMNFASDWRKRREMATSPTSSTAMLLVEKATGDLLSEPDWAINMDICDTLNSDLRQARDVIKAVKKRLMHKNPMVQFLALTLLETMIKNCGDYVHLQVVECEVLYEMVKIVKKTDIRVRDKILVLLDAWQEAFGGPQGKYPQYFWAYVELKGSGVEFPPRLGDIAPIFTPPIANPSPRNPSRHHRESSSSVRLDEAIAFEKGNLSLSNLESMRRVMELLKDMLEAVNPNDWEALQDEVIIELVKQCCSNQKKIMHFVNSTRNEELLFLGLALNDDLQNLIVKYNALATGQPVPTGEPENLSAQNPVSAEISEATGQFEEEEDEDDGFTQLARRNSNIIQHTSDSISPTETGSVEPYANKSATSEDMRVTTSSSPSSSIPAIRVQKEQDIATLLSTLSTCESSHSSMPPTANTSTFISPISYDSTSSSANSYCTPPMLSSPISPINPLALSPSLHSGPNQSLNSMIYPYNPQPHPLDQGYTYCNYVAPWAQQSLCQPIYQIQPERPGYITNYPPPPWETSPSREDNHFLSASEQIEYDSISSQTLRRQSSIDPRGVETFDSKLPRSAASTDADVPSIPSHQLFQDQGVIRSVDGVKSTGGTSPM